MKRKNKRKGGYFYQYISSSSSSSSVVSKPRVESTSTMELCINSTTRIQQPLQSLTKTSLSVPLKSSFLPFATKSPSISGSISPFSRQTQRPPFLHSSAKSIPSAASSSTSATASPEIDRLPADIQVSETKEPNSRLRLNVDVPRAVCDDCYSRVLREFMKKAKVPGFRPGKNVPENILLSHIGKQNVQRATVESILKRTLPHAMASVTGRALKESIRIVSKFADLERTYSSLNSLSYDVIVDVVPEVKWNPEDGYKNLKIVVEIESDVNAQNAFERELRQRHKTLGSLRIVTDRGLQVGDVAVIDVSATTIDEGEANAQNIPDAETKGFHFDTEDGDRVVPGFLDSLIGIKQGETKSFPLVFPESWKQDNLRGVHAQFTVNCKELFYRVLPELDDSLADKLLPGCTTLQEVKDSLLQTFLEVEQTARQQATDNALLDLLCKMVEVDIPESLFEEQGRQMYGARLLEVQANMKLNEEQLATVSSPTAVNEYLEGQKENITKVIKQNLAVGDIFKRENLQVSTEELVKEVENSITEFKRHNQEYDEERVREQVLDILEGAKVLEWLRQHADIQYR